jgi:AbiV family abortive infection protein
VDGCFPEAQTSFGFELEKQIASHIGVRELAMNNSQEKTCENLTEKLWTEAISACVANGDRILDDAKSLDEFSRFPSALALAILAQEEFAKAYLLKLVNEGAIPLCDEVLRACRDHSCKHLIGLVMAHLFTPMEDWLSRSKRHDSAEALLPAHVADALNIFCYEKLRKWRSERTKRWLLLDYSYDKTAERTASGSLDRVKQNAVYVGIGPNGITSTPRCTPEEARKAIETAEMLKEVARGGDIWAWTDKVTVEEGLKAMLGEFRSADG